MAAVHSKQWLAIGAVLLILASAYMQVDLGKPIAEIESSPPFEESIRVSFDKATSSNVSAAIDPEGNVHVVWVDNRSGNGDIYYVKLDSHGNKLVNDVKITNDTWRSMNPTIAIDDQYHIYIVWQDDRLGHWELFFAKLLYSPRNITFISNDVPVSDGINDSIQPFIAIDNAGDIMMVWSDSRHVSNNSNYEIYYKRMDSDGVNITVDRRVTSDPGISVRPSLAVSSNNTAHLVWYDFRDSADGRVINHGIFFTMLTNDGQPLLPNTRITFASIESTPAIVLDLDGNSHIVFDDDRYADFDIFYTKLDIQGITVIDDIRISPLDAAPSR
ncbi:MAG TPA: hypothetical protein ENN25_02630, partial [Euryarchaeota archaeon]|nr:hypothetical protein [Euryarchaeota archaeon]